MVDPRDLWNEAVKNGRLDIIYDLHSVNFPGCTTDAIDYAALHGNLNIFHFLYIYRKEGCSDKAFLWAAVNGHIEMLKTLYIFYPERCDIVNTMNYVNIINVNNKQSIINCLELYYNKCHSCNIKINSYKSILKNTCRKCYYIQFPHLRIFLNCQVCYIPITNENCCVVNKTCKSCYNKKRACLREKYRIIKKNKIQ